jgi:hypothetical protein
VAEAQLVPQPDQVREPLGEREHMRAVHIWAVQLQLHDFKLMR